MISKSNLRRIHEYYLYGLTGVFSIAFLWTASYWSNGYLVSSLRDDGYFKSLWRTVVGTANAPEGVGDQVAVIFFVGGPLIAGLALCLCLGLLWLRKRRETLAVGMTLGLLPFMIAGTWLGFRALRLFEAPHYYDQSQYVILFRILSIGTLVCATSFATLVLAERIAEWRRERTTTGTTELT